MKTKRFRSLAGGLALSAAALLAQPGGAEVAPDEVVVSIGGVDFTAGRIALVRANLPQVFKQQTAQMDNRTFLETFGYLQALAQLGEQAKLLEKEPYRTQFEFTRTNFLAQAYLQGINSTLKITEQDTKDYYEKHKRDYEDVRVSAIYVDYTPIPDLAKQKGKDVVTEQDAWAKAEKLAAELREGADFAELARERSDDKASAEKGGDLGIFRTDAKISDRLKETIFSLKEGQISSPVKDGGRFYIFKLTERKPRPLSDIQGPILQRVQTEKLQQRLEEIRASVKIEYKNQAYLGARPDAK